MWNCRRDPLFCHRILGLRSTIFIADVFHTIAEVSLIIFDLHQQFFADAKPFELERLYV